MANRAFSTSALAAKDLTWKLRGTTQPVDWAIRNVSNAVDMLPPSLSAKVNCGEIKGDPHPTGKDPLHASGKVGWGNMKMDKRISFHAYPDGRVVWANKDLAPYNRGPDISEAFNSTGYTSAATGATTMTTVSGTASGTPWGTASGSASNGNAPAQAEYWIWSPEYNDYYHLNDDGSRLWYKDGSNAP